MKNKLKNIVLRLFNRVFSCNVAPEDIASVRLLAREGIRFGEGDAASIRLLAREGIRFGEGDAASIRLLVREGIRFGEGDAASIKLLVQEKLHIRPQDVEHVRLAMHDLSPASLDCLRLLCGDSPVLAKELREELVRPLEELALLNRLHELGDMAAGTQLCYSQEGESLILERFFDFRSEGFYVDVGAHHPKRFSNTYSFYRRGWRGINIDPTPGVKEMFDETRPEDITYSVAVSDVEGTQDFYLFGEPALNTFSPSLAEEYQQAGYKLAGVRPVETRRLAGLFDECRIDRPIDFMSIDVEDHELPVLRSNDWTRFRPRVLLVEILNFDMKRPEDYPVHEFILGEGYELFAKTYNTLFYKEAR